VNLSNGLFKLASASSVKAASFAWQAGGNLLRNSLRGSAATSTAKTVRSANPGTFKPLVKTVAEAPKSKVKPWLVGAGALGAGSGIYTVGNATGQIGMARNFEPVVDHAIAGTLAQVRASDWMSRLGMAFAPESMFSQHLADKFPQVAEPYALIRENLNRGHNTGMATWQAMKTNPHANFNWISKWLGNRRFNHEIA